MAFDEPDGAGEPWSPPYISKRPAGSGRSGDDDAPRGWQRRHTAGAAAAVLVLLTGATTLPFLVNGSGGEVTVVAASPLETAAPTPAPTPARVTTRPTATVTAPKARRLVPVPTRTTRTPTITRTAAPATSRYVASPAEIDRAEAALIRAEQDYRELLASPKASSADREVVAYEWDAANQHLIDLRAGRPDAVHRRLRIREAKAYLAKAEQSYRRAYADPTASQADRVEATAVVEKWQERLAEAKRR